MNKLALEFCSAINRASVKQLLGFLNGLPVPCDLLLLLTSDGGNNFWAQAAFAALATLPTSVDLTAVACGPVDSSAVAVFCAAPKRLSLPHARFLFHPSSRALNEKVTRRRLAEISALLEADEASIALIVSAATGIAREMIQAAVDEGTVWMADEAKERGLVQDVLRSPAHLLDGRRVTRLHGITD